MTARNPSFKTTDVSASIYHIPARFHAYFSLLGRSIKKHVNDPRRAESLFVAVLVLLGTGLILIHFLLSSLAGPLSADTAAWFWGGQLALFLSYVLTCLVGVQPHVTIRHSEDRIVIRQDGRERLVPCASIEDVERVSDTTFYRHYRRYENTQSFVNRLPSTVLLLHTSEGPVALGLSEPEQKELLETLRSSHPISSPIAPVTS